MLHSMNISSNSITNTMDDDPPPAEPPRLHRSCNRASSYCNPADYVGTSCSSGCWRLTVPPPPVLRHYCSMVRNCDLDADGNPCRIWGSYSRCHHRVQN